MIRQLPQHEVIPHPPIVMEIVTDPEELALARAHREQFEGNSDWFDTVAEQIYRENRGKHICVAGQECFVADTVQDAIALAKAAHPDDKGFFFQYIPRKILARIYAYSR